MHCVERCKFLTGRRVLAIAGFYPGVMIFGLFVEF
jgi:hypothetical protein